MAPELLGLIFKNIYLASRAPRPGWYDSDSDSESESEETDNEWEHNLNRSMQRSYRHHLRDFPPDIEWTTESMHSPTWVKLASDDWDESYQMNFLAVYGKGPRLEVEDISWFEKYRGETSVSWDVKNDDGYTVEKKFLGYDPAEFASN